MQASRPASMSSRTSHRFGARVRRDAWRRLAAAACGALVCVGALAQTPHAPHTPQALATRIVEPVQRYDEYMADAVVESTRQTAIAAQVPGRVIALYVKAGDHVAAGAPLVNLDARAADQQLAAVRAQADAARAELDVAKRELERTRTLFGKQYVSQAALERAAARYQAAAAMTAARQADVRASGVEPSLRRIAAPYAGTVASVGVELGSMAMPGAPLVTLFDPASLRALATVPQSRVAELRANAAVDIELPDLSARERWQKASSVTILPESDPQSHSVQIRLTLPASAGAARPGMFARAHFPIGEPRARLMVPASAVVHRTEVSAVYVVMRDGRAQLRQVRVGETRAGEVEILAGLSPGERIALDPLAAAEQH